MDAVLHALLFTLLFFVVYYIPGRILLSLADAVEPEEKFVGSIGLGLASVSALAVGVVAIAGLYTDLYLKVGHVIATAAVVALVGAGIYGLKHKRFPRPVMPSAPTRNQLLLLGLTLVSTIFYLVRYDSDQIHEDNCIVRVSAAVIRPNVAGRYLGPDRIVNHEARDQGGVPLGGNDFLGGMEGQRVGPPMIISPTITLFGSFGLRLVYALQGLLLPGLGFLLGRLFLGGGFAPWLCALLLAFNPYSLEIHKLDENFMALPMGALALLFLARNKPALALAAIPMALFLEIRHIGILLLPGVIFYMVACRRYNWSGVVKFLLLTLILCVPAVIRHYLMYLDPGVWMEGTIDRLPAPHSFLGMDFESRALWNWPLVPELLRSPYNGYPNLVAVPLDLIRRYGFLLLALIPPGIWWFMRKSRPELVLLLGWSLPFYVLAMVKSGWVEPNKMSIPGSAVVGLVVLMVGGLKLLSETRVSVWQRAVAFAVGLALPSLTYAVSKDVKGKQDTRILEYLAEDEGRPISDPREGLPPESPEYVEWDRNRHGLHLLPPWLGTAHHSAVVRTKFQQVSSVLAKPWLEDYQASPVHFGAHLLVGRDMRFVPVGLFVPKGDEYPEIPLWNPEDHGQEEAGVAVHMDFSTPPAIADKPFVVARDPSGHGESLTVTGNTMYIIKALEVPWARRPVNILMVRDRFGMVQVLLLAKPMAPNFQPPEWLQVKVVDGAEFPSLKVPMVLPVDYPVRISDMRVFYPHRMYQRLAVVEEGGNIWLSEAESLFF